MVAHFLAFGCDDLVESLKQLNVVGRGDVEDSLELFFHHRGTVDDGLVGEAAHLGKADLVLLLHVKFAHELQCHLGEGIIGPAHEPIDCRVVDQGRVLAAVVAESLADWTHADSHVQIVLDTIEEEFANGVGRIQSASSLLVWFATLLADLCNLVWKVQVRHRACAKLVVDVLEE